MTANVITIGRTLFSVLMFVIPTDSVGFFALYLLCGISDILDGFVARKLHTESDFGAMLDSAADLVFAAVYAVRILPLLHIPLWIWLWTAAIAVVKLCGIAYESIKARGLRIRHSVANKLTGLLIFLLPFSVRYADVSCGAAVICSVATLAAADDIFRRKKREK